MDFEISEQLLDPIGVRLLLSGELDLAAVKPLSDRLRSLAKPGAIVVLDMSRVGFVDSTGIGVLVRFFKSSRRKGWQLRIEPGITSQVQKVLELSGIDHVFWPERPGSTADR